MSKPIIASIPEDLDIADGAIIRCVAVDPNSGATVGGVVITNMVITASVPSGTTAGGAEENPVPLLVPVDSTV